MEHFRVPKDLLEHDIIKNDLAFKLFLKIIGNACYKGAYNLKGINITRGQWLRSRRKLQEDLQRYTGTEKNKLVKPSPQEIVIATQYLINNDFVITQITKFGTLFTVLEFSKYQGFIELEAVPLENHITTEFSQVVPLENHERFPQRTTERFPQRTKIEKGLDIKNNINKPNINLTNKEIEKERKRQAIEELMTRDVNSSIKDKDKFIRGIFDEKDLRTDWSQYH